MGFEIKPFAKIVSSMINYARATQQEVTDFSVGSVARTLLESPAIEIEELYQRMLAGILEAIPTSIYRAFGFDPLDATPAYGYVVIRFAAPLSEPFKIEAGAVFVGSNGVRYVSDETVVAPAGATHVDVPVTAAESGAHTNIGADEIVKVENRYVPAGAQIGNDPIVSGRDAESEEDRQQRFAAFIRSISRGTVESVLFAARSAIVLNEAGQAVDYVTRTSYVETPGYMAVYIHGATGMASDALIKEAQRIIDGWTEPDGTIVPGYRPAGIVVEVLPMSVRSVDIGLTVRLAYGTTLAQVAGQIKTAVSGVIANTPSDGVLLVPKISDAVLRIAGVESCVTDLTGNIYSGPQEVLALGNLSIEVQQ